MKEHATSKADGTKTACGLSVVVLAEHNPDAFYVTTDHRKLQGPNACRNCMRVNAGKAKVKKVLLRREFEIADAWTRYGAVDLRDSYPGQMHSITAPALALTDRKATKLIGQKCVVTVEAVK